MEAWHVLLLLAAFYGFIYLVGKIIELSKILRESKRQKQLDGIASAMLTDFDFNKETREIRSIGDRYESSEIGETKSIGDNYMSRSHRCPRCGGTLVVKNGRYGRFWGCSRYPNCKYTRDVGE